MHEHSITNEIVHQIVHACEDNSITSPKRIVVELGTLTTFKKEPLLHYFKAHKKEIALLKDAELEVLEIRGRVRCKDCDEESDVEPEPLVICPKCGSMDVEVIQGGEVIIKEIKD